jgi:signal transduction histidine kinase
MLFLREPVDGGQWADSRRTRLSDVSAQRLERALLSSERSECIRELNGLLADDPVVAEWAIEAASRCLGRDVRTREDASAWWSESLERQLAWMLSSDSTARESAAAPIEWRLLALAKKLAEGQRRVADFDERLEHEKLESLKELAYGASHEINNPLANIAARAQTLLEDETDAERRRKLVAIHRQAMRAHEMIADLMLFARPPKLNLVPCDVYQLAAQIVAKRRELAGEREIELACRIGDEAILPVMADETQIAVAIDAIVINAIEAVGANGRVEILVRLTLVGADRFAEILVCDNGPGISENVRRHMFDPFFSGREAGRGLGFGLSKCWRIVSDHGGRVVVYHPSGRGAEISILLPLADCVLPG